MSVFGGLVWSQRAITKGSFDLDLNPDGVAGDPFRGLTGSMRAMRLAYSYACVRLISDWVAAAPLHFFSAADDKERVDAPAWYADPYPAWGLTPEEWMFQAASSLVMHGNTFGLVRAVDDYGLPAMVRWVSPLSMSVSADGRTDELEYKHEQQVIPTSRVAHARTVVLAGSCIGASPVDLFRHVIDLGLSAFEFTARWFTDGGHPTTHLGAKGPLTKTEAGLWKERWDAATKGRRGVVVTGNDVTVNKLQESPKDSNAIEVQQQAGRDAATVWGVPAWFLGLEVGGMTYSNVDQLWTQFQTGTCRFVTKRLEAMFNRWLPPSIVCRFSLDTGVRADLMTRMQAYAIQLDKRIRSVNEVRDLEDLPPAPWGDAPPALPEQPPTPREDGNP